MKLCIADPPYLGRAVALYGENGRTTWLNVKTSRSGKQRGSCDAVLTRRHRDAAEWDSPARHQQLVAQLMQEYDGWAIAMWRDSLPTYLAVAPIDAHVAVWVKPNAMPGGRVITAWEPVLVYIPKARRSPVGNVCVQDVLTCATKQARIRFVGGKPEEWTNWVLDMLGYDEAEDTVDDLFPGSGAVTAAIAQQRLPLTVRSTE